MNDDPGWRPAFAKPHLLVLFWLAPALLLQSRMDGLARVRAIFFTSVLSLVGIYAITTLLLSGEDEASRQVPLWSTIVAAAGVASLVIIHTFRKRVLRGSESSEIGAAYVTWFFLGYALALAPGLIGFVSTFTTDSFIPLNIGFGCAALGLVFIAPTRKEMQRWQSEMQAKGIQGSFVRAVIDAPAPRGRNGK